jgi:hypothetical protein
MKRPPSRRRAEARKLYLRGEAGGLSAESSTRLEEKFAEQQTMAPLAVNRRGLLKSLLLSLTILIASAVVLWAKHGSRPTSTILFLGPLLILVWSMKLPLLIKGVAVEFTAEGLTDRTTSLGFIAWSEILSAHRKVYWFGDFVELKLKDPNAVIARQPWLRALALKSNIRYGLPGPSINAGWVAGGADAILASLRAMVPTMKA